MEKSPLERNSGQITFHLGLHKTGSTFLQEKVFPKIRDGEYIDLKKSFDVVLKTMSTRNGPFLCSSENIGSNMMKGELRVNTLARLAEIFPGSKVILFLREPAEWLVSCYTQFVMQGAILSFDDFLGGNKKYIDYEKFINDIKNMAFGDILLLDYKQFILEPSNVIKAIAHFIGDVYFNVKHEHIVNKSINVSAKRNGLRFIKFMNHFIYGFMHPSKQGKSRSDLRRILDRLGLDQTQLVRNSLLMFLNRTGKPLIPEGKFHQLLEEHEQMWQRTKDIIAENQKARVSGIL